MEIECDLASIRDEDLLRKMWQQSEDFGRKKEIRSHLYKLRESRLREFYSTGGPGGDIIMNPSTDMHFGKAPLTPSHGDSLVDQSFQSLKSKEVRDSLSPSREIKFRNSGGVAGGVLVPDTTGWDVQTSSEVSPDGRAFRTETLAKTDGVEKIPGGHSEFAGRNEQKSSASHQGDDKNYVKKAAESSKTHLQEKVVIGDENSGRTEMKSSSVTSSSKVFSSSSQQVISSGDPEFDMEPRRLMAHDQQYQNELQAANTSNLHSERQQFSRNERNERNETSSNIREESKKYVDMDKASPEYQQHVQYLMSQPGAIISNTVEYPKPGVKMITTVKKLPDGTTVKTKRYETEAGADSTSVSKTMKQQQQQQRSTSSTTSQKTTEKRIQDSEDVFTRLARTRDSNVPASPRNAPETPSTEDDYSRLQQSRGVNEQKFSDSIDQRSTQVLRDSNQHPGSRNAPTRRPSNLPENVEMISTTNKTVKKDLNHSVRSEKITSSDFIQNERDRYVLDHENPSRRGPDGYPDALAPITPSHHVRPKPQDDYPSNGYPASSEVIKQSSTSKTSAKFSESRRFSTETVESYQHSENENQDYTTRGYPSNRRPIDEPKGRSPSSGRPTQDFSTHGFPSVRSDKPTQQYSSDRPSSQDQDDYNTTERVHVIHSDRSRPGDAHHPDSSTTTRSNYSTNETRRHVTSTKEDFSTHGFPSVRAGTPTGDLPRRPLGSDPTPGDSPRRPSGQEPPVHQARKPPSDGFSTHGFPSVKSGSPTEDSPRRPSAPEPTNQGRRPTTGRSTPTQSAPQHESSPRVDRDDTTSVTSDRSNSITYEKRIDAAHQAFARSLRCASPVESVRRDSTSDRHSPRSSIGSIRNTYSPSKRDGRSPSHDSITNSESSRISSGTVTKSHKPTEVRRVSGPKSPMGKSAPSHVSNDSIDLSLTRKITSKPSPEKTTGRPTTVKEVPSASAEPILRKKIFGATENFLASEAIVEKPILKKEKYQLGLSDATLPSSHSKARHQLGTTPNTSRRPIDTEEEVNTLLDTATKHITTHPSPVTPTTRSAKNQDTKPSKPETLYSKKPITKPEGYITQTKANEINEKHNQTTNKHVSYPHYIPSAPKADRSPSDKPTTNNFSSPAPNTTTSTTPHNAPKSTKDKVKPSSTSPTTTKPFSSPSKVDNSTPRFTKTVKPENAINRDTTTKTRRQPKPDSESEPLPEPEDLDEGYVPDRKGTRKPNSQRPTSDDEGFEPDSPRAGSPTSDFEYRRPEQIRTYDEEDSFLKKKTDKKTVTNDFLITERDVKKPHKTEDHPSNLTDEPRKPRNRKVGEPEKPEDTYPNYPKEDDRRPSSSTVPKDRNRPEDIEPKRRSYPEKPEESYPKHPKEDDRKSSPSTVPKDQDRPDDREPKRPSRRPKGTDTEPTWSFDEPKQSGPNERNQKPSPVTDEPGTKSRPYEPRRPKEDNREPSYPDDKPSKTTDSPRPRGTKPPLERSETFEERCRQILGMETDTVVDRTKKTQEFIETERTTVDSKRKPSGRSPSPEKNQPSDTVSIEDCDDDDSGTPRKYPTGKTSTTTTTLKTTRDHPRDKSPSKKGSDNRPEEQKPNTYPRDSSPTGKVPKGTRPNEFDETTTVVTTTRATDRPATSPNRKTPEAPSKIDHSRPRDHSPSEETVWIDETSTIRRKAKIVDESDERTTRSKPGSRPRDRSPQGTRPITRSPADDSDTDDHLTSTRPRGASPSEKRPYITTRETTFEIDSPRDKSPSQKPVRESSPTDESPRGKAPSKKPVRGTSPTDESPRDESPLKKPVRGTSPTDETITSSTATMHSTITDGIIEDRYPSYTPKAYPRERSPSDKQNTRPRTTTDESPREKSPSQKPVRATSPIEVSPREKSPLRKPARGTSPTGEYPREKSPSRKPARGTSPTDESPREKAPYRKQVRETSPSDEAPRDKAPSKKPVRSTSPSDEIVISSTTAVHSTITDGVHEDRYPSYTPKSYPRDHSPSDNQSTKPRRKTDKTPRDESPSQKLVRETSPTGESPREMAPSIKPVRGTSPTDEAPRDKAPSRKPVRETSPSDESPRHKAPSKNPLRSTSPSDGSPRDKAPSKKPVRGTSPTDESPRDKAASRKPVHETSPSDESPRHKAPSKKPIRETSPSDGSPRGKAPSKKPVHDTSPTDETIISSTTTMHSTITDGIHEDRYPSYTPKSYPRDRSPAEPQKPRPRTTEEEDVLIKTLKTTKKTSAEEILDDVFEVTRPRERSPDRKPSGSRPDTSDGSFLSHPRDISPSENVGLPVNDDSPSFRPKDYPRDRSPQKPSTKETEESITNRTTKTIKETTIDRENTDRTPSYPRDRSPNEKFNRPVTEETDEYQRTVKTSRNTTLDKETTDLTPSSHPRGYPRDRPPVDDLTHPSSKETTETRRTDKKTVINEFLDTERGIDRPQRPKDDKPINERLTSSRPRDYPNIESPSQKPKRPTTDESTTTKTTKSTRDTNKVNETDQLLPSSRPRDRSPNEKPIRSPRIVTTETTTEYGISERPRSQSPSEKTRKPVDSEEIDETIVQKTTKFTKDTTIKSDLVVDVEKPSRRTRPTRTEDQPLVKTPGKPKETRPSHLTGETPRDRSPLGKPSRPSDRSPSPHSKQPKEQRPTPGDTSPRRRSPVGKDKRPTGSPRQSSPSEKSRNYQLTEEETRVAQKLKSTRVTTTSKDITEVEFEDRPRDRSPYEKPRSSRPVINDSSPRDLPRGLSPSKKPEDQEQTDSEYEETLITRRNKTTRDENSLEEKTYLRETSPLKPRGSMPSEDIITTTTVIEEHFPKGQRGTTPSEKPNSRDYPRDTSPTEGPRKPKQNGNTSPIEQSGPRDRPRGKSPNDRPRRQDLNERIVVEKTSIKTITDDRLPKSPRQTSPSGKPREIPRDRSPTDKPRKPEKDQSPTGPRRVLPKDKPDDVLVQKTTRGRKTVKETDHFVDECCQEHHPSEKSPSRKPKDSKPNKEIVVQRKIKTTTVEDHLSKTPRSTSPTKTSPREKSPTQKPSQKGSPRKTSPSRLSKDRVTSEKTIVQDRLRKSPSEKPKRRPSSDEETDDETTETIIAVYTIDGETVGTHPRESKRYPTKPSQNSPKKPQSNGPERPRGTSPSEKIRQREPTDEEVEETYTQRQSKITKQRKTLEEIDIEDKIVEHRSPRDRYPKTSPEDRSRDVSPAERASPRSYPRDTPPQKPYDEVIDETVIVTKTKKTPTDDQYPNDSTKQPRNKSPSGTPRGPRKTEDTILFTTTMTKEIEDHPRDRSPTGKPRDKSPAEKAGARTYPRDRSPLDKQSRPKTGKVEETTNRSVTSKRIVQETDFEKRFPKGRPGDQSPSEKPSTLRRPSKISTTMSTTTTRNRSTLDEEDINRTQRPRTQPSTREKIPTKSTPLSSPRTQPTIDRRVPAELPSPGRKPKSTFGVTTKTTTTTRMQTSRPKPTMETPKKPSKLPLESRPSARAPERKLSPSISPDSSPSRPASEVEVESPYRSPNMSPSRKSPSPTRSVKLEDITSSVNETKKTVTVTIDKSKPKTTHVTTAKFQVTPPESPTKSSPPSKKPSSKVPTSKTTGSRYTTDKTTTKKVNSVPKDVPTDSERDSEIPSDAEEVDTPLPQKPSTRKLPVTERKESAPVHRVTRVNKDIQMSRSTSENIIKTPIANRPVKHEPLQPITQREPTKPIVGDRSSPKTERRPSKHLSTKTINLTTFDKVINSQDMENVVIDIQHAKSSREQSPNKIVPTPVSIDLYTGKPRYPDVVTEPEDEPKKKPNVKNIPIFEEETNDFVGCQITEINEDTHDHNTITTRTTKYVERESSPQRRTPRIITSDNVDNECLLSVHDKVSKFISTAEEVSKPKTSAPFRRDVPEEDMPEDDECLMTVDEKVNKFLKTADSVTREVITSKPRRVERPSIEDMDEELRTDECVLSVSEKVNKFTTKAEKLAPSAPQRSPELVARVGRQISRQSDVESESPECEDSPASVRKFKPTSPLVEKNETKYTERQIDILSRPSVWDKKPKPDVKLDDIFGYKPEDEPESVKGVPSKRVAPTKTHPDEEKSKPIKPIDSVSKRKELFENKVSSNKTTVNTKRSSPERRPIEPTKAPIRRPSDQSDSRYPNEFTPRYVDGYSHNETDDDVHEDVYGSSKTRRVHETTRQETTAIHRSPERSPTRKSSHPEIRPTAQTPTRSQRQPDENTPSRRYSEDHSPRYTRDQPQNDRYMETRETSEHTTRRRSSTQEYPERRTPNNGSLSPSRKQPVEEPEDYSFSSRRGETNRHSTTRTAPRSPKDIPLNQTSLPDDEDLDHSPARSTSTISSHRQTTHRTTSTRLTEDISSRRPRRPSGNEPTTPTTGGRTPRGRAVPETVAARRNIFEKSPGDISPMPSNRRPSYMEPTKSSLEHRKDSIEITKTNFSRKSSVDEEPYEPSPKTSVKFGVGLKHKEEPKPKRKLSSSDIPNIEDVFELELLEEMLNIVTLYEQRRRIRAQIRVVKKLLETKTKEEVSRMTKISTIRKTSSSFVKESPTPRKESPMRPERYQPSDDIDSESIIESRHIEEHEEIIRERSISPKSKTSRIVSKVTETRKIGEPSTPKRTPQKKDEPKDSKPIWATKNILKKPSENEKVVRALSAKKTTSTSSSSMSRTQQTHHQRVTTDDDDCVTSSYGIGPTDEDGRPLFGIRALKKKTTTNNTAQPSETTKVTGTVITEKYYSENGAEPVGERKVTVYSTNPEDLTDMETQYDRRDSETVKREKLSKDGLTTVTKVQKIGKYKPGEIPSLTDDAEFSKTTSKMVRRGSVKEMSEKFIRKESSSSVTEKSSGYPKAGLILRTRTNSGATADTADQYEVRAKSTEYDYDSEDEVEIRTSRKHSKVVTESDDETEIRRKVNTRSFLNSAGSKVTGIDDVLDRMRNADNVVVDGDTLEDREARSLLNKFLGASVLMTGMESMIPQKELRRTTAGADSKQEVKTTRVTKTIKTGATGGSSSSPVTRETCDIEEIWDEEILKQLLEKSTSYEERRSIRARLRQLMAEREACAELKAGSKAELNETKAQTSKKSTQVADDESSGSEYEEIIEEYTASEDDDEDDKTTTTTVIAEKKKDDVKEDKNVKKITEEVKKTTITKKEEPKSIETKKTIVVETTSVIEEADAAPSCIEEKKQNEDDTNNNDDDGGDSASVSDSKGESLLIPLLQGLLHKNMPQARSSSGSSSKIATISATTSNKNSNNLKSSLKANNTHFSSTSNSNNNNSLGDSGLSSEVSRNSSLALGQKQSGSSLRATAPQQIEDSGTESGEDLRLIAAGIRDSMQIEGIENHSDMSLIKEVTNALNKLESSLKEGKDLALDNSKKSTLLALVERLQTGLTAPDKLSSAVGEQDFPDETSSPEADNHRSNRQRFAKRKNRNNRHTVGVSKEELADARRYIEEMVMIENLSNCTTPECNAVITPPELFAIQKQQSAGAIISSSHEPKEASGGLFRPNQFVPNNLKHSTEAGSAHPDVQMRQKKGTPGPGQRQSTGDMASMKVPNSESNNGKRPLSDTFDSYTAQSSRVTFSDSKQQNGNSVQERNQYNRSYHSDDKQNNLGRLSPDSNRLNRFNNKKQLMKRANTIDIPKTHRYNPEFDTDSDFEDRNALNSKGLRGTVQVTVKRKPRQVVPNFEPKTENDHKFLAFIQKQSNTTGLGWNSSKSVSNWTNKFGNIKNVFESGAHVANSNGSKSSAPQANSSAKNFWKKSEEQNPPKISTSVLTSALKAKELNEKRGEVVVPKPIHMNKFSHNPQSAFRPVDISPETIQMQFKPIPMERPANVSTLSPTKAYNPVRRQALESPHYAQSSPTKSWIKKNTATNSPVTLPWTVKPAENNVLKIAATKFESQSPVQRHQSFKQQEKRPSLPNAAYPYQYQDDGYSQPQQSYVSNSQPVSYAEYPPQPRIFRESSLTNPQAAPLVLTPNKPAYSPHSLQPFEYYNDDLNQSAPQTDMTDDDIDDMESMTEYRVEAKVMGKPTSQQAVTVGKRTSHMSDDEVFGKNSRAAKSLLSVMKNIGNGNGNGNGDKTSKKLERKQAPMTCKSPNGSAYVAPIVEPLFPEVTKFEANREPEYIGKEHKHAQQAVDYQQNPVYVPLEDYQQKQPPVAPPRGRKVSQERKKGSAYVPQERPNVYQQQRRDAPSSLPVQAGPTSPPRHLYSSPSQTPDSNPSTAQILNDGMYMQNVPAFRKPYSEPNTPSDYSAANEAYFNQYGQMQKSYQGPQPPVILPQIPLETSYTKVYDQPRDVTSFYKPSMEQPNPTGYNNLTPKVQQSAQPPMYGPSEYQQKPDIPNQYYQTPKVQHSPLPQAYQPRAEYPAEYYQSPKVQQSPQPLAFTPQQPYQPRVEVPQQTYQPRVEVPQQAYQPRVEVPQQAYQPRVEVPPEYYNPPKPHQILQPQGISNQPINQSQVPATFYQSPQIQPSAQAPMYAPQYVDAPVQYNQSPKVLSSPRPDNSASYFQSPKFQQMPQPSDIPLQYQQQSPKIPQTQPQSLGPNQIYKSPVIQQSPQPQPSEVPLQYQQQSQKLQTQPLAPQQSNKSPVIQQNPQSQATPTPSHKHESEQSISQSFQSSKIQQSPQPMSPPYKPKAPLIQSKPQVSVKNESVTQSSKSQHSSSTYLQQQMQSIVSSTKTGEQQIPNAAVLCKQASLEGRKRVQSQSQKYEEVEETRRKSLGNVLEMTRIERESREQKAAAIKQDMYSVQQDVYSQQKSMHQKTEVHQQETKVVYKSSAPDDTPDIVKSSLKKDDIPILKKFGPPQRHCYIPNAYQNPLTKSETTVMTPSKIVSRKFSDPAVTRGPVIVETPSTPQPDSQDEIPRNIVFNNVSAFTSMSRRQGETSTEYTSQQSRPNKLSKCDSWHQICQLQNIPKPPSPRFNTSGSALRRSKSGHTLAMPKLYEASYDRAEISEKQKTVAAYFGGQKSPNSLSRNSSQTNLAEESNYVSVKKSSINRIKTSEKASISRKDPSSGLSRSHTMPQIANVNLLDESNVEDAFEQLMNGSSTTTTEKTQTKNEDGGVVTTTTKVTTRTISGAPKPVSPFAKFQQLDKQSSMQSPKSPNTPTTPGGSSSTPIFRFTDPALNARAATFKEQLLQWCQSKTQEYENVQITNFSASWTDGLAFCALIHHFLPDAFDYSKLNPKQRRYNFELAFRVADEKAGIAPLLDVEDMVVMKRPDWKCVFTYVQSIYRRFRNCQ